MLNLPEWHLTVPGFENQPVPCDVWSEEEKPQFNSLFQVDNNGFFLHIHSNNIEDEVIEICQISDVRPGVSKESKCFSQINHYYDSNIDLQRKAFTVCSGTDLVDITYHHIICADPDKAEVWRKCLLKISKCKALNNLSAWSNLIKLWKRLLLSSDQNKNIPVKLISRTFGCGKGDKDIHKVLEELKLTCSDDPTATIDRSAFTFDRFYQVYIKMCGRDEIHELFKSVAKHSNTIDAKTFANFLNEYLRDGRLNEILFPKKDARAAKEIIQRFEVDKEAKKRNELTLDGFLRFLMSDENSPVCLNHLDVYMDMEQPLAHYYINSSHNTYLTGRQFYGKSSVDMYRRVLLAGCRCVELDCWDGEDGEPMITHGKAICTYIPFLDVLYAIRDTAFVTSEYPVILSLENHCSKKQQESMARYCEEVFKELLLKEPLPDHPLEPGRPLPSPKVLKNKILLKNKRLENEKEEEKDVEKETQKEVPEVKKEVPEIKKEVPEIKKEVPEIKKEVPEIKKEVPEIKKEVPEAQKEVPESEKEMSEARKAVTEVQNKVPDTLKEVPDTLKEVPDSRKELPDTLKEVPDTQKEELNPRKEEPCSPKEEQGPQSPLKEESFVFDNSSLDNNLQKNEEWKGPHCTKDDLEARDKAPPKRRNMGNEDEVVVPPISIPHTGSTTNIHPYLSKMVNYAQPIKFLGFEEAQRRNIYHNMSSFSETTGLSMLNAKPIEFVNYNKRQMSRIYPRGTRLDSSNFMPSIFWSAGCQMAALNFQTPDLAMQINQGKFEYNGNCGYLLKPDPLRSSHRDFNMFANSPIDGVVAAQLTIQVISGQFLSDKRIGTYVEVDMYGLKSDTISKEFRTKIVPSNGLNPRYEHDKFCFRKVVLPELAILRFGVYDETNRLLGQRVIPFESLRSGYRHIPLRTEGNYALTAPTLFCHIELTVYVPDHHWGFLQSLSEISRKPTELKEGEEEKVRKEYAFAEYDRRGELSQKKSFSFTEIEGGFTEICVSPNNTQVPEKSGKGRSSKKGSKSRLDDEKVVGFPDITVDMLKQDNDQFAKLIQKQEKKLRHQKMKHSKQLETMSRNHCLAAEKLEKQPSPKRKIQVKPEAAIPGILQKQVDTWSKLKENQREAELSMRENHLVVQYDQLERLMKTAQARQIKELQDMHKRHTKRINSNQAKASIKAVEQVKSDSSLKSNGEKERCVREKKEQMTKLFAEERRLIIYRQTKEMDSLQKQHQQQSKRLANERAEALQKICFERKEHEIDKIREFCA